VIEMGDSEESGNAETVRALYESFAQGDVDAVVDTFAPDIELREPTGIVGGGTFRGEAAIRENLFAEMADAWEAVEVVPDRFVDGGDTVVALVTWRGTNVETGRSVEFRGAHVFDFEDGEITRWTSYADTALFNAAVGSDAEGVGDP
jgi:ketosteroid isomerase-like protein